MGIEVKIVYTMDCKISIRKIKYETDYYSGQTNGVGSIDFGIEIVPNQSYTPLSEYKINISKSTFKRDTLKHKEFTGYFSYGLYPLAKGGEYKYEQEYEDYKHPYEPNLISYIMVENGKWGYINNAGKEIIPFIYDSATSFLNGYAVVSKNGDFILINTKGQEVMKCESHIELHNDKIIRYSNTLIEVFNNKLELIAEQKLDKAELFNIYSNDKLQNCYIITKCIGWDSYIYPVYIVTSNGIRFIFHKDDNMQSLINNNDADDFNSYIIAQKDLQIEKLTNGSNKLRHKIFELEEKLQETTANSIIMEFTRNNQFNTKNKYTRDEYIHFDSTSHTYTYQTKKMQPVTKVIEQFFPQFDTEYWARIKAPQLGMPVSGVIAMWKAKGEEAAKKGTLLHQRIDDFLHNKEVTTNDDDFKLFKIFCSSCLLNPFRTEWTIYDETSGIAGTVDLLDYTNGKYTIYDWKRSNKIVKNCEVIKNYGAEMGLSPINDLENTAYWHYTLQLSFYRYILETKYNIEISESKLVVLHPENQLPYVLSVPYMKTHIIKMIQQLNR